MWLGCCEGRGLPRRLRAGDLADSEVVGDPVRGPTGGRLVPRRLSDVSSVQAVEAARGGFRP
jgi:hypothetical protein